MRGPGAPAVSRHRQPQQTPAPAVPHAPATHWVLVVPAGKRNKLRVYYLSWLRNKILHNDPEVEKKQGWTTVGDMEGCVHYRVGEPGGPREASVGSLPGPGATFKISAEGSEIRRPLKQAGRGARPGPGSPPCPGRQKPTLGQATLPAQPCFPEGASWDQRAPGPFRCG